jgi:hypothetical protein
MMPFHHALDISRELAFLRGSDPITLEDCVSAMDQLLADLREGMPVLWDLRYVSIVPPPSMMVDLAGVMDTLFGPPRVALVTREGRRYRVARQISALTGQRVQAFIGIKAAKAWALQHDGAHTNPARWRR